MFGFSYEYIQSSKIFQNIGNIFEYGINEIVFLILGLIIIFSMIFFIIPAILIFFKLNNEEKIKNEKKRMMNKIVLQKNLEDLILRELNEKK